MAASREQPSEDGGRKAAAPVTSPPQREKDAPEKQRPARKFSGLHRLRTSIDRQTRADRGS